MLQLALFGLSEYVHISTICYSYMPRSGTFCLSFFPSYHLKEESSRTEVSIDLANVSIMERVEQKIDEQNGDINYYYYSQKMSTESTHYSQGLHCTQQHELARSQKVYEYLLLLRLLSLSLSWILILNHTTEIDLLMTDICLLGGLRQQRSIFFFFYFFNIFRNCCLPSRLNFLEFCQFNGVLKYERKQLPRGYINLINKSSDI